MYVFMHTIIIIKSPQTIYILIYEVTQVMMCSSSSVCFCERGARDGVLLGWSYVIIRGGRGMTNQHGKL